MAETGLSLVVSKEMLANLQKADNAITNLATKSEQAKNRIVTAFTEMGQKGVGAFLRRINEAQRQLVQLGASPINFNFNTANVQPIIDALNRVTQTSSRTNITINGIDAIGNQANNAIDAINRLVATLSQLQNTGGMQSLNQVNAIGRDTLKEMNKEARKMKRTLDNLDEAMQRYGINASELAKKIQDAREAQRQFNEIAKQQAQQDVGRLLSTRGQQKTLNELKTYAKELERTMNNLDPKSKEWVELNKVLNQTNKQISEIKTSMKGVQTRSNSLLNISEQLQRRLALVFSVSQITGYVNKLISVRGEFELQQRALQAILQNKEEANKLWEKTVQLAVQSPFQVKELVTYTKQLAAYRVESDKLYDTTKMLADVSAGLGVDMQRLILAFGQVKAANYLRGTELRQFSEAGINILGELATYFTELEGITVSVGEVFERVSKRMVTFGDVEEIFKRLTSAGGTFYRMQEIQAETLRGQISNLKDSIDIMLNEVGKANEQTLKNSVALVRNFVESWERIVDILQAAGAAFVVVTAARVKDAIAAKAWSAANIAATASATGLNAVLARTIISLKALWTALLNNPITAAVAGLTALGVVLYKVSRRNVEANKALQESANKLAMQRIESEKYTNILTTLVKKQNELVEANKSLSKESSQYKDNISKINELEQERKNILNSLESVDATYAKNLREIGTDTEKLTEKTSLYNEELRVRIALEKDLQNISSEDFIKDYNTAIAKLNTNAARVETTYANTIAKVEQLLDMPIGDGAKKIFRDFLNSSEPYVDRVTKLYETLSYNFRGLMGNFDFKDVQAYIKSIEEVDKITKKVVDDISKTATTYKATPLGTSLIGVITNAKATDKDKENAKNNIIATFEKILDDKAITGYLRTKAQETLSNIFNFKWEKINTTKPLEEWKVAYNDFIATLDQEKGAKIAPASLDTTLEQLRSDVKSQIDKLSKEIVEYENAGEELKKARKTQYENDKVTLENYKKIREFLGYTPEKTTDSGKDNTWTNLMRVVKEVNTEFKNLNKTFDKTTALQGTLAKYSDALTTAFKGTGKAFTDFDFTTESGLIEFYDWLIEVVPEVDKLKAQLAKGEVVWDVRINKKELEDKALLDQIEEMFRGYEVSLELQKLNIPKDWAKDFFGIETFDLSQISQKIEEEIAKIGSDDGQKIRLEKLKEFLEKVKEMEVKAQQERLKTYLQYARDAVGDRAKIKLEEMRKLQEIEKTFTSPEQEEVKQKAIAKVRKDSEQELNKIEWDEFQKSDTFMNLFADLDSASSALIEHSLAKLREFKEQWKDMPMEDMRAIVQKINELEIALAAANPFEGVKELRDAIKAAERDAVFESKDAQKFAQQKDYASAFAIEREYQEERLKASEDEISNIETILRLKEEGQDVDLAILNTNENLQSLYALDEDILKDMLDNQQRTAKLAKTQITNSNNYLINLTKQQKKLQEQADAVSMAQEMANNLYDAFKQLNDALGGSDSVGAIFADMGMQMLNTVLQTLALQVQLEAASIAATAFGIAMNSAMGIIGWIVMAVQLIAQVLSAVFAAKDKRLEKQIEKIQENVDLLNKNLEQLEEHLDKAFNVQQLQQYTKEIKRNINAQIKAYEQMIKLEEDKKKTDKDKVKGYKESIEELKQTQKELQEEAVSTATSGILDSVKDAARGFVDAWYEAFAETGDGLQGLKDNFKDIMLEMVQQQATLTIAGNFLDRWKAQLDKYINKDDLELTTNEAKAWIDSVQKELPQLNEALETYFKAMEQAGLDLSDTSGELSGLQRGIQELSETTGQELAAYLNSIRFFVADTNTKLSQFVDAFFNTDSVNPMLSQLRIIAQQTTAIHTLLDSLTTPHPTLSGRGLKVVL